MQAADIARIVALGAPVLCVDTCTILDLIRDPTRKTVKAHERQASLDLLTAVAGGQDLVVLLAEQVMVEFDQLVGGVRTRR